MKRLLFSVLITCCFFISVTNASIVTAQDEPDTNFDAFLKKFASSAEFQYSRVKFPLISPIILLSPDGDEIEVPFTVNEWVLLEKNDFLVGRNMTPDGVVLGNYIKKEQEMVIFESGLEESDIDLIVTFELSDGKWYATDCYNGWYGSLPAEEFEATLYEVQQRNADFEKKNP